MEDEKKEKKKTVSNQVLEYYKQYSQSKDLPRYFCGSSDSLKANSLESSKEFKYFGGSDDSLTKQLAEKGKETIGTCSQNTAAKEKCSDDIDIVKIRILLADADKAAQGKVEPEVNPGVGNVSDVDNPRGLSPTSSIASNRKLEWDNAADIGYDNSEKNKALHKSLSLPVLSNLEEAALEQHLSQIRPPEVTTVSQCIKKIFISSSSTSGSSGTPENKCPRDSSSSTSKTFQKHFHSSSSSTSKSHVTTDSLHQNVGEPLAESTPFLTDKRNSKLKKECLVQEPSKTDDDLKKHDLTSRYLNKKIMKLCVSKPITVECLSVTNGKDKLIQTSFSRNKSMGVQTELEEARLITKTDYNSPKYVERQNVVFVNHAQEERADSNSNSFDFVCGEHLGGSCMSIESDQAEYKSADTDKYISTPSSLSSPLGDLISAKHSGLLIHDVEKSIDLLRQLLKSKKYDKATKKYYLNKIVKKIVNNHYVDDSSSTSHDDTSSSKEDINLANCKAQEDIEVADLQKNVPWTPVEVEATKEAMIQPTYEKSSKVRNPLFTLTNNSRNSKPSSSRINSARSERSTVNEMQVSPHSSEASKSGTEDGIEATKKERSWREEKTVSEMLFEEKRKSCGDVVENDCVVDFAKKERDNQLNWINGEITHLSKLKELLQKNKLKKEAADLTKPCVENFESTKKSTAVYMITTEKDTVCRPCRCDQSTQRADQIHFHMRSNDYRVRNCLCRPIPSPVRCSCPQLPPGRPNLIGTTTIENRRNALPNRKLLSRETYVASDGQHNSVRRYVFEIPFNAKTDAEESVPKVKSPTVPISNTYLKGREQLTTVPLRRIAVDKSTSADNTKSNLDECTNTTQDEKINRDAATQCTVSPSPLDTCFSNAGSPTEVQKSNTKDFDVSSEIIIAEQDYTAERQRGIELPNEKISEGKTSPNGSKESSKSSKSSPKGSKSSPKGSKSSKSNESSGSSSSSSSSSSNGTLCPCCRKYFTRQSSTTTCGDSTTRSSLCPPCFTRHPPTSNRPNPIYTYPGHVCNCYSYVNKQTIDEIRKTVKDLDALEAQRKFCTCNRNNKSNKFCSYCNCKLQKRNGIAYTLKFEPEDPKKHKTRPSRKKKDRSLEEITIKIPYPFQKKKQQSKSDRDKDETEASKENNTPEKKKKKKHKHHKKPTLQDYLCYNRPNFVQSAEERRKCMVELAFLREQRCEKYKQLLALTSGIASTNQDYAKPKRMFTTKEMKQITAKHYKMLPEVQQKKLHAKKLQIDRANKLLADMFNKNLRDNVLKGNKDFSTTVSVANIH